MPKVNGTLRSVSGTTAVPSIVKVPTWAVLNSKGSGATTTLELRTAQIGTFTIEGTAVVPDTDLKVPLTLGTMDATAAASGSAVINPSLLQNQLTLRTASGIVVTGNAVVNVTGVPLTLRTNETGIITWNEIIPGATMVWKPIVPY